MINFICAHCSMPVFYFDTPTMIANYCPYCYHSRCMNGPKPCGAVMKPFWGPRNKLHFICTLCGRFASHGPPVERIYA